MTNVDIFMMYKYFFNSIGTTLYSFIIIVSIYSVTFYGYVYHNISHVSRAVPSLWSRGKWQSHN